MAAQKSSKQFFFEVVQQLGQAGKGKGQLLQWQSIAEAG